MKLDFSKFLPEVIGIAVITVFGLFLGSLVAAIQNHLPWDFLEKKITLFQNPFLAFLGFAGGKWPILKNFGKKGPKITHKIGKNSYKALYMR